MLRPGAGKELYDGALPSINSVALSNLVLLSRLTGNPYWEERAQMLTNAFAPAVSRQPADFTHFLNGLDLALRPGQEIVVTGGPEESDTRALLDALHIPFAPHLVTHLKTEQNALQTNVFSLMTPAD